MVSFAAAILFGCIRDDASWDHQSPRPFYPGLFAAFADQGDAGIRRGKRDHRVFEGVHRPGVYFYWLGVHQGGQSSPLYDPCERSTRDADGRYGIFVFAVSEPWLGRGAAW